MSCVLLLLVVWRAYIGTLVTHMIKLHMNNRCVGGEGSRYYFSKLGVPLTFSIFRATVCVQACVFSPWLFCSHISIRICVSGSSYIYNVIML